MSTTAQSRASKRDYWNRPDVVRACKALDYGYLLFIMATVMILGSINL